MHEPVVPAQIAEIEALCNTPDDVIRGNVRINALRDLLWIEMKAPHDGHAVICGSGPSLADTLPDIKRRQADGQTIFALNGAADFLKDNGVTVDYQILIDARPNNVAFVRRKSARHCLIASQCAPALLDALEGELVTLFHLRLDDLAALLPKKGKPVWAVSGRHTSGLVALSLVGTMGYRLMHLYGYDSSFGKDGPQHAFPQDRTAAECKLLPVKLGQRWFYTNFAMYKQAEEFPTYAQMLADAGCTITVHGHGLLPAVAQDMVTQYDFSAAVYDFNEAPSSWDFTTWLIKAEMMRRIHDATGPLRVQFMFADKDFVTERPLRVSSHYRRQMFDHVIQPVLALVGAVEDDVSDTRAARYNYVARDIVDAAREGHAVPRFVPLAEDIAAIDAWLAKMGITSAPFVITLREAAHWRERNSQIADWLCFADDLKAAGYQVVFVRDTERAGEPLDNDDGRLCCPPASLDIRLRCALYHRAACNFMVSNGPSNLAIFGERPFLLFKLMTDQSKVIWRPGTEEWWSNVMGVPLGTQFPWALPTQRIVWKNDDYQHIRQAWNELAPLLGVTAQQTLPRGD
jgi:hypothetical protein